MSEELCATGNVALDAAVNEFLRFDSSSGTDREKIATMIKEPSAVDALKAHFLPRISFGTAGLRAAMAPGYACMNELVVLQTSQGICKYLEDILGNTEFSVVLGFDGRHNSKAFALRTAAAFLHRGVKVYMFSDLCPTPYVAFATRHCKCAAGIMITASHNPKEDNGYKVEQHALLEDPTADVEAHYVAALLTLPYRGAKPTPECAITYTAMHGVGYPFCQRAFAAAGFQQLHPVAAQVQPDADFPTVKYPNPEEGKGALALAIETAAANGSTVILANDPDADRLAVAVQQPDGEWRILNGNELGAIFGWWVYTSYAKTPDASKSPRGAYMLSSTVSSQILKTMAKQEGFHFEDTLTGFKWMGNRARDLQAEGYDVLFSFEEAIGFAIGSTVVDKDGVSAAVVMAGLVNQLASEGSTLLDCLNSVYDIYGYHATYGSYYICHSKPTIEKIFADIRNASNGGYSRTLCGQSVVRIRDLTTGFDDGEKDNKATLPIQSSNMITWWFSSEIVLTLRTSGTEPKIKFYSEIKAKAPTAEDKVQVRGKLASIIKQVTAELLKPTEHGLEVKAD